MYLQYLSILRLSKKEQITSTGGKLLALMFPTSSEVTSMHKTRNKSGVPPGIASIPPQRKKFKEMNIKRHFKILLPCVSVLPLIEG